MRFTLHVLCGNKYQHQHAAKSPSGGRRQQLGMGAAHVQAHTHTVGDRPNQMFNNVLLLLRTSLTLSSSVPVIFFFPFLTCWSKSALSLFSYLLEKPEIPISPGVWRVHPLKSNSTGNLEATSHRVQQPQIKKHKTTTATLEITPRPSNGHSEVTGAVSVQEMKNKNKTQHRGDLLLKVTVLHIAKEALQFRYSTYQQFDQAKIPYTDTHRHTHNAKEGTQLCTTDAQISKKLHSDAHLLDPPPPPSPL